MRLWATSCCLSLPSGPKTCTTATPSIAPPSSTIALRISSRTAESTTMLLSCTSDPLLSQYLDGYRAIVGAPEAGRYATGHVVLISCLTAREPCDHVVAAGVRGVVDV